MSQGTNPQTTLGTQSTLIFTPSLSSLCTKIFSSHSLHPTKQHITSSEFRAICESLSLYYSNEKFRVLWQRIVGRERYMSEEQFRVFLVSHADDCDETDELRRTFDALDVNKDGYLDYRDLEKVWNEMMPGKMTRAQVQNVMGSMMRGEEKQKVDFDMFCGIMKGSRVGKETSA